MIDFAKNEDEEKNFIVDIETTDDEMIIRYADGHEVREKFSYHNLNVYRLHMEEQAKNNMDYAYDIVAKDSFMVYAKRILAIIGGIIGGIVIYNVDIHIIMKIVLALILIFSEGLYYLYNELYLSVLSTDLGEILATDYYLKNIDKFKYYDSKMGEYKYIVPIEDIEKHSLTQEQLEEISDLVSTFRKEGITDNDISLTYKNPSN